MISGDERKVFEGVRSTYLEHLNSFTPSKQFHFLSRCYLWTGKDAYHAPLVSLRPEWWKNFEKLSESLKSLPYKPPVLKTKVKAYRSAYFLPYVGILRYNRFFFKCLFDQTVYGGDAFSQARGSLNVEHHHALYRSLHGDPASIAVLATPAVNFLTLSSFFFDDLPRLSTADFLRIGEHPTGLQGDDALDATVYFHTHAIIGMSRFYAERIQPHEIKDCREILMRVECVLTEAFERASLDHKCEFLVCASLCGYTSPLEERIKEELLHSISPAGYYFINMHNTHSRERSMSLMEHTNVLALMAFLGRETL